MKIESKPCPECGDVKELEVSETDYRAYTVLRQHIQDAFPTMPADDRERLLTGICPSCWDRMLL